MAPSPTSSGFFNTEVSPISFYGRPAASSSSNVAQTTPDDLGGSGYLSSEDYRHLSPMAPRRMALGSILNHQPPSSLPTLTSKRPSFIPTSLHSNAPSCLPSTSNAIAPEPTHRRLPSILHASYPPPPAWAFERGATAQGAVPPSPNSSSELPTTACALSFSRTGAQVSLAGSSGNKRGRRADPEGSETDKDADGESDEDWLAADGAFVQRVASASKANQRKRALRKEGSLEDAAWKHERDTSSLMEIITRDGADLWRCRRCYQVGPILGSQFGRHYKSGNCDRARRREEKKPLPERPPLSVSPQKRRAVADPPESPLNDSPLSHRVSRPAPAPTHALRGPAPLLWTSAVTQPPSLRRPCTGARIRFFEGAVPVEEYIWKRNRDEDEAWRVFPVGGDLFAKSLQCLGERGAGERACSKCSHVLAHRQIASLQVRRTAEEVKGLRLDNRSHRELQDLVHEHQRAESANFLKNQNLQRSCDRATAKSIVLAEMIQIASMMDAKFRVGALFNSGLKAGRSLGWIMKSLLRAKEGKLKLSQWTQEEIDASLIVDIIGKSRATSAMQHLGGPGRTFLRERRQKTHLLPGTGNEEQHVAIMLANLDTLGFIEPPADQPDLPPIETFSIGSDEVSDIPGIEVCHRIDAFTGLAMETMWASSFDVNFRNLDSAVNLWDTLNSAAPTQQLVSLTSGWSEHVRRFTDILPTCQSANIKCVAILKQHKTEYQAMPIFFGGHARSGRDWEMESRIFGAIEPPLARWMQRLGWIYVGTASDGDRPRQLFEAKRCSVVPVVEGHKLYPSYSQMKGITPRVGEVEGHPVSRKADARHLWKTGRAAKARPNGITVSAVTIRPETYVAHCKMDLPEVDPQSILNALLPPDPMCVAPAVQSFQYLFQLRPSSELSPMIPPMRHQQRHALNWIAVPYRALLRPFLEKDLSLSNGMTSWSKGGWAQFIGHILNPVDGLPTDGVQNWLSTVQATFTHLITRKAIAVARGIRLDFFICLEGENEIEALFAAVKLAGGTDTGLSLDRLARLAGEGLELNRIYGRFPHLRKGQKGTRNISNATGADHCSPHWLTGDSDVRNVDIIKCWNTGRQQAFDEARANPLFGDEWVTRLERELDNGERDFQRPAGFYLKWDRPEQIQRGVALKSELDEDEESQRRLSGDVDADQDGGGQAEETPAQTLAALTLAEEQVRAQVLLADPSLAATPAHTTPDTSSTTADLSENPFDTSAFVAGLVERDEGLQAADGQDGLSLAGFIILNGMVEGLDDEETDLEYLEEASVIYINDFEERGEDGTYADDLPTSGPSTRLAVPQTPAPLPTGRPVYRSIAELFPNSTDAKPLPTRAQRRATGRQTGPQTSPKRCQVETDPGRWGSKTTIASKLNRPNGRPAMWSKDRATKQSGRTTGSQASENRRLTIGAEVLYDPDNLELGDEVAVLVSQGARRFLLVAEIHALNLRKGGRVKEAYVGFAPGTTSADNAFADLKISELHPFAPPTCLEPPEPTLLSTTYHTWGCEYLRDENSAVCAIEVSARHLVKLRGSLVRTTDRVVIEYTHAELAEALQQLLPQKALVIPSRWPGPYNNRDDLFSHRPPKSPASALTSASNPQARKNKPKSTTLHPCAQCGVRLSPSELKNHVAYQIIKGDIHPEACAFCGSRRCQFNITRGSSGGDISALVAQRLVGGRAPPDRIVENGGTLDACEAFQHSGQGTTKRVCGTSAKEPSSNGPLICLHCDSTQRKKKIITRYGAQSHYSTAHPEVADAVIFTVQQRGDTTDLRFALSQQEYTDVLAMEEKRLEKMRAQGIPIPACKGSEV
ncbi:hypothetical protein P7C70_g4234, partial [Phenoliferia sp. Uapishka_3]